MGCGRIASHRDALGSKSVQTCLKGVNGPKRPPVAGLWNLGCAAPGADKAPPVTRLQVLGRSSAQPRREVHEGALPPLGEALPPCARARAPAPAEHQLHGPRPPGAAAACSSSSGGWGVSRKALDSRGVAGLFAKVLSWVCWGTRIPGVDLPCDPCDPWDDLVESLAAVCNRRTNLPAPKLFHVKESTKTL